MYDKIGCCQFHNLVWTNQGSLHLVEKHRKMLLHHIPLSPWIAIRHGKEADIQSQGTGASGHLKVRRRKMKNYICLFPLVCNHCDLRWSKYLIVSLVDLPDFFGFDRKVFLQV